MQRRTFLGAGAGAFALPALAQPPAAAARRPNVIWIFGDQHRAQALGCSGDPNATTPNLDTLAAQGVRFNRAVSGMPLCCPFRGSLLTSRYPHECVPGHEYPLPAGQPTVAQAFGEAGYRTAWFGKWHLGGIHEAEGRAAMRIVPPSLRGGFQTWTGYDNNNSQYDCWVHGGEGKDAFHYRLPGYESDALTDLLIQYVGEHKQEPFFAALSLQPPHNPYVAPPRFMEKYNPARVALRRNVPPVAAVEEECRRDLAGYYAQIENLDWNIGRVREALDRLGLTFNTHILYFSDHGDMHGSHGQFKKMTPHEESIRIPMIIAGEQPHGYDGRVNGVAQQLLNHVDIAPTSLGLCGIPKPKWMRGIDYSHRRLRKGQGQGRAIAAEADSAYLQSVIPTGHGDSVDKPWRGVVTNDGWKYVCFEGVSWLLFNLNEDPYELVNVAHNSKYKAERKQMLDRVRQLCSDTGDKFTFPAG